MAASIGWSLATPLAEQGTGRTRRAVGGAQIRGMVHRGAFQALPNMVEQMVCKRDKAHCSPIRRRFLTLIVAALLLTTAEAQTERVPWSKRTKMSVLVARRDARAKQEH